MANARQANVSYQRLLNQELKAFDDAEAEALQVLALMKGHRGKWKVEGAGMLRFTDPAVGSEFSGHQTRLEAALKRVMQAVQQMMTLNPPGGAASRPQNRAQGN